LGAIVRNLPPKLPYETTLALIVEAQHGSVRARNEAITGNMRLVAAVAETAARAVGCPELVDDLIMAGAMGMASGDGLLHAVMTFDVTRGARFATYAHPFIREAVNKQLAALGSDLTTYKVREKRTTVRNAAAKLSAQIGRPATATEVQAALSPSMRSSYSVAAVELALQPHGRETHEEAATGGEDEVINAIDDAEDLSALRLAALASLSQEQRNALNRRYNGETLRGKAAAAADAGEAKLRALLVR
jgi:DNA-directed RNA polymerase specialized sigma subunit